MNNKRFSFKKIILIIFGILVISILVFSHTIPFPEGRYTEKELSDPDSRFIDINGVSVHYKMYGNGKPVFILLHGTMTTTYTWHEVTGPLSKIGTVIAYDRTSFGLTSRPMKDEWNNTSPFGYEIQSDLVIELMDAFKIKEAVLVGNSMGGAIAMMTSQRNPERVKALVLVDPVQNRHAIPHVFRVLARTPLLRKIGPLYIQKNIKRFGDFLYPLSYHDPSKIKPDYYSEYFKITEINNFARGIWELLIAARPFEDLLAPEKIKTPTLVIAGADDRVAGIEDTSSGTQDLVKLSKKIKDSKLAVIPVCGHVPQEECPVEFIQTVMEFIHNK